MGTFRVRVAPMKGYGQFCSIARALDLLGERWTLLVVRELLCGSTRFSELRRGIPRISRTMLAARLRELIDAGVVTRAPGGEARYALTEAGRELAGTICALGTWGQRWVPRTLPADELDADLLVWDIQRRVRTAQLPATPLVMRIELTEQRSRRGDRFLLLRRDEVSLCAHNPGFPEELHVRAPLATLTAWWRGDLSLTRARAAGMVVTGRRAWVRAFPSWFERYLLADVPPARRAPVRISDRPRRSTGARVRRDTTGEPP
jgi:DNA-binding HxlR family transcriptional regulator